MEAPLIAIQKEMQEARKNNDQMAWALAFQKGAAFFQFHSQLEEAVHWFLKEPWPQEDIPWALTSLSYFKALSTYRARFGWEISKREAMEDWEKQPIRFWTQEQFIHVQNTTLGKIWQRRAQLESTDFEKLSGFGNLTDFEKLSGFGNLKDGWGRNFFDKLSAKDKSLRGELSLLWAGFLREQRNWTVQEQNESWELSQEDLAFLKTKGNPTDAKVHSLMRSAWVYEELQAWHRQNGRAEEAAEVFLFHLLSLNSVDLKTRCAALETQLPLVKGTPGGADIRAQLAIWLWQTDEPIKSHAVLQECVKENVPGPGTARCREELAKLLEPELFVNARLHNAPGKSALKVRLRNVPTLYFRAYTVLDLPNVLAAAEDRQFRLEWEQGKDKNPTQAIENKQWIRLLKTWKMEVPQKGDWRTQELEVTPPLPEKGAYWLVVSANEKFAPGAGNVQQMLLIQTELALVVRELEDTLEVLVSHALTGAPEAGVNVRAATQTSSPPYASGLTNQEGKTNFKKVKGSLAVWVSRGKDIAVTHLWLYERYRDSVEGDKALVSLDRAIYRPGQPLFYKAVLVRPQGSAFSPVENKKLKVTLKDSNNRETATQERQSNAFGSISGEFKLPEEGLLGNWRLEVSDSKGDRIGIAALLLEEYKRPTFEARFLEKQEEMKLNAPVKLQGEAKYYFGQALSQGKVKWRVERVPRWLKWWWLPAPVSQRIAQGESAVGADGRFEVNFVAKADPSLKEDVAYLYKVTADVLDEGGETQPLSYSFHLGMRALNPVFQVKGEPFFVASRAIRLPMLNQNLSGIGQKGQGTWKLYSLNPKSKRDMGENTPTHPLVSNIRSRVSNTPPTFDWQAELRTLSEDKLKKQGAISLDAQGKGEVELGLLSRGAYRVVFETRDTFGNLCQAEQELLVVDTRLGQPFASWVQLEKEEVGVGEELKLLLASRHEAQAFYVELFRKKTRLVAKWIRAGDAIQEFKWRVGEEDRGGLSLRVLSIRNFEVHNFSKNITVPWDNKELALSFSSFRDKLRPGEKERFVLSVSHKGKPVGQGEAEVLGLMYDRSLDVLRKHVLPTVWALYGQQWKPYFEESISLYKPYVGIAAQTRQRHMDFELASSLRNGMVGEGSMVAARAAPRKPEAFGFETARGAPAALLERKASMSETPDEPAQQLRQNFAETAFFLPTLTTDERGQVTMHFEVPDALTSWKVLASAHNQQGQASPVLTQETQTSKELMVRPYVPRFLREGDEATLAVVVNNKSDKAMSGELVVELFEPETNAPLNQSFGLAEPRRAFHVPAQGLVKLEFALKAPMALGMVALKAVAKAGEFSDGEQRLVPILPSRMHLAQSRFVALKGKQEKHLLFEDMAKTEDASRVDERLVVTVDGQLLTGILEALPYLASYPYECTEQTFNRFFSAGMVASVFGQSPQLVGLAAQLAQKRTTPLARFDGEDANRRLALEETPFLLRAKGGEAPEWMGAINLLEPGVAQKQAKNALAKLARAQNADGGFPWFAGGHSSVYITSYLLIGFARAKEFSMPVPGEMVARAWKYLKGRLEGELKQCMEKGGCVEDIVLTNYAASLFDTSLTGLSQAKKKELLAYAEARKKTLAPRLRVLTALTWHHMKDNLRAKEWLESWMQFSRETENEGRFWAPESMSWVWYNDTLETHAFTLHALTKISPNDARAKGLVQWIFLNKKLSHWRSTRTTAEALYAVVGYLKLQNQLGQTERLEVSVGPEKKEFVFEPSKLETGKQQWVFEGKAIQPKTMGRIRVAQKTDGFHFASATWHFSTQRFPTKGDGDLFAISRAYFKRVPTGSGFQLIPLREGEALRLGEEVEVQLTLQTKAPAEYVHLRDARAAGFEPRSMLSGWKWEKGYACYEEVRDSAQNYFFESLPQGEFRFSYRLVASMAGTFRLGPATVQSMYAPEFAAYSKGHLLRVIP